MAMPELPEMENYRTLLTSKIEGKLITGAQVNRDKSINMPPDEFINRVNNRTIITIERRAKHLLFHLDSEDVLLLHLMLGGWMFYGTEEEKPQRTVQVQLSFGDKHLFFIDLRLGYLHLHSSSGIEDQLSHLGPEPLDAHFTEMMFSEMISAKRGILKTLLVDQHFISGIGNLYSDEICYDSRLLPTNKSNELTPTQTSRLYQSIRSVLPEAIRYGGYMEDPFYRGDTLTGTYNSHCKVYDEEGKPCLRCGHPIIKREISSRKCFFCNNCQE